MTPSRVLITGATGQLGSDLAERLEGSTSVAARSHAELDIADEQALARCLEEVAPDAIFNCAAYHNLDECELHEDRALAVNSGAVAQLAGYCAANGAKLVHLSTNYVFDGHRDEAYAETDEPNPESAYARTKLAGEKEALSRAPSSLVVRTAGLYGLRGSESKGGNFVTRMLARAREGAELKMVADQRLTPTWTADLADSLLEAVELDVSGVVHLTSDGECSWFEFTEAIMELAGIDVPIQSISTTVPEGGPIRPLNGVLARPGADAAGLARLPFWRDSLRSYMERAGALAPVS